MKSVVITFQYQGKAFNLELPTEVPISVMLPILFEKLGLDSSDHQDKSLTVQILEPIRAIMRPHEKLVDAGIVDGYVLGITQSVQSAPISLPETASVRGAALQALDTGKVFSCRGHATLIGRDRHLAISLANLPNSNKVSRTHANIVRRADGYWIKDERSTNGTIVDGHMLDPGESVRLRQGSQIQFGVDGPVMVFLHN